MVRSKSMFLFFSWRLKTILQRSKLILPLFFPMKLGAKLNLTRRCLLIVSLVFSILSINRCYALDVGESYGGGTIFCVSQTPDITKCVTFGSGNYGLIMADEDQANFDSANHGVSWATKTKSITTARSDEDGASNTNAIITALPEDNPSNNAAWLCRSYRDKKEGHDDWYLPSKNELNKICLYAKSNNLIGRSCLGSKPDGVQCLIGGDKGGGLYWSSTEKPSIVSFSSWFQSLGGQQSYFSKANGFFGVRAIRTFALPPKKQSSSWAPKRPGAVALTVAGETSGRDFVAIGTYRRQIVNPGGAAAAAASGVLGGMDGEAAAAAAPDVFRRRGIDRFTFVDVGNRAPRIGNLTQLYPQGYVLPTLIQAITEAGIPVPGEVFSQCDNVAACAIERGAVNCTRLTREDAATIALYTFDFGANRGSDNPYRLINQALFARDTVQLGRLRGLIYRLLCALRSVPPAHHQTLFRGIRERVKLNETHYSKGKKVTWHTFSSATTEMETTQDFLTDHRTGRCEGTLFIIRGTPWGYNIQPFSCFPDEREILLEPEINFRVTGIVNPPVGLTIIDLEMLPDQRLLLENRIPRYVVAVGSELPPTVSVVPPSAPAPATADSSRYVAQEDWQSTIDEGLSFKRGDIINIMDKGNEDWWMGELNGNVGWVPSRLLQSTFSASS